MDVKPDTLAAGFALAAEGEGRRQGAKAGGRRQRQRQEAKGRFENETVQVSL